MANLTIAIDDELLRRARIKAVSEGTSVNEVCRQAIEAYVHGAQPAAYEDILGELRELSRHYRPDPEGEPAWPGRDALYEPVMRDRGLAGAAPAPARKTPAKRR
jgi:hypothetical protein